MNIPLCLVCGPLQSRQASQQPASQELQPQCKPGRRTSYLGFAKMQTEYSYRHSQETIVVSVQ